MSLEHLGEQTRWSSTSTNLLLGLLSSKVLPIGLSTSVTLLFGLSTATFAGLVSQARERLLWRRDWREESRESIEQCFLVASF